jgi:hypothetical protein
MQQNISVVSRPHNVLRSAILKPLNIWFKGHKTFLTAPTKSAGRKSYSLENYDLRKYNASVGLIPRYETAQQ